MLVIRPENCNDVRWSDPVTVQFRYGFPEEIETPLQALNCLAQRWPSVGGDKYVRARHLCMAALGGRAPCETVRTAFIAAAEEAYVLVHSNRISQMTSTSGNLGSG